MRDPLSHAERLWILALRHQIWDGSEVRNPLALGSGAILYLYISIQFKGRICPVVNIHSCMSFFVYLPVQFEIHHRT